MLRERCSCAVSVRSATSSRTRTPRPKPPRFALPSLFRPLSPTIPVHPRNAPVSPIIPVHTQKQGGGAHFFCSSSVLSTSSAVSFLPAAFSRSSLATRHSPLSPIIPAPLATAALRVVPAPIFTTTSSIHVGAPTILFREPTTASQQFPDRRALFFPNCALLTGSCELLFSPKSNYSRTYAMVARKSNYSRTYAKQGVGVGYLNGNVSKICRRADNFAAARLG